MKTTFKTIALVALVAALAFGQGQNIGITSFPTSNPLVGSTTLSFAVAASDTQACVASATGIVTPSLSAGVLGSVLFLDNEAMQVTAAGITSTCFRVKRGQLGTSAWPHPASSFVWIGNPDTSSGDTSRPFNGLFPLELANAIGTGTPVPAGAITATTTANGTIYFSAVYVPINQAVNGLAVLEGSTCGTDKRMVYMWDYRGNLIANSAVAGATCSGTSLYQSFAFTTPIEVAGPFIYFVGVQANGTTDKIATYVTGNIGANWPTGSVSGTFGTVKNITPTSSFTTAVGPVIQLY